MKRYLLIPLLIVSLQGIRAQTGMVDTGATDSVTNYRYAAMNEWMRLKIFKAGPSLTGLERPLGGVLAFETGTGLSSFSLQTSLKYFHGNLPEDSIRITIKKHIRLEFQPRYYPVAFMKTLYILPLVNFNYGLDDNNFTAAIGGGFGWQMFATPSFVIDTNIAIQTANAIEHPTNVAFLRFGLLLGFATPKYW